MSFFLVVLVHLLYMLFEYLLKEKLCVGILN